MKKWWLLLLLLLLLAVVLGGWFLLKESPSGSVVSPLVPQSNSGQSRFKLPQPSEWTLLLTGDIIPARVVNQKMVAKNDFNWPLVNIAPILKDADLTLINLESPLLVKCPITNEGFKFCGDYRFAQALADSGVDVANLANNHSLNYGWEGLAETEEHLQEMGIETTGFTTNSPQPLLPRGENSLSPFVREGGGELCQKDIYCSKLVTKNIQICDLSHFNSPAQKYAIARNCDSVVGTIKVGFIGYNAVGQTVDRELVEQEIRAADKQVDILILSVHWGKEYERTPKSDPSLASDDPKELGRLFIDWGADVVVGNHPHWYQSLDFAQDKKGKYKPIFYALGNTIFDQEWSPETKVGYLAKLKFVGTEIKRENIEIIPIGIRDYGQAYVLEGKEKEKVLQELD